MNAVSRRAFLTSASTFTPPNDRTSSMRLQHGRVVVTATRS